MSSPLDDARRRIDVIDGEVLALLAERARITRELAEWKRERGIEVRDPSREEAMIEARRSHAEALGLHPWVAEAVTRVVLVANRGVTDDDRAVLANPPADHPPGLKG